MRERTLTKKELERQDFVDNSNPDYSGTLDKIGELKDLLEELEERFSGQIGQGLAGKFALAEKPFLGWIEEIESTLIEYSGYRRI
ncbi:MAG: hypothetical protein Q8Q94_01680 [bacterium]|nr:hypothetical protein [bacterium]MDZ4299506.1 hypothetical protein [Candidatus Sungbacteria bacterium]